jgi:hypothetical protein
VGALDEADLKAYILSHADGGGDLATPDVVGQLFSLTGGVPERVDHALAALKVVTLSELMAAGSETGLSVGDNTASSIALLRAIKGLGSSADGQRALEMLQVLTMFPHGAQFEHQTLQRP